MYRNHVNISKCLSPRLLIVTIFLLLLLFLTSNSSETRGEFAFCVLSSQHGLKMSHLSENSVFFTRLFHVQAAETDQRHHRLLALALHADVREPLLHQKVSELIRSPWTVPQVFSASPTESLWTHTAPCVCSFLLL